MVSSATPLIVRFLLLFILLLCGHRPSSVEKTDLVLERQLKSVNTSELELLWFPESSHGFRNVRGMVLPTHFYGCKEERKKGPSC